MTIAAALTFDRGILLAADTKHTFSGYQKLESTKIFTKTYAPGERSAFVISGDVDLCVSALQRCEEAFQREAGRHTLATMHNTVERILRTFYKDHIYPHPEPRLTVELFVVLTAKGESSLYRNVDTALRRLVGYDCRGSGAYLAHSILRNSYNAARSIDALSLREVYRQTMRALKRAKDYDDGCGLSSEVMVISLDGRRASPVLRIKRDTFRRWREALKELDNSLTVQV